jgi:PAS domain S-box-containing protein
MPCRDFYLSFCKKGPNQDGCNDEYQAPFIRSRVQVNDMKDEDRTKKQLISELRELRHRNAERQGRELQPKHGGVELRQTRDHLDNIIESSLDGIVVGDSTGNIVRVNKSFLHMIGYRPEEVRGKHVMDLSVTEEGVYKSTTGEMVTVDEAFFNDARKTTHEKLLKEGKVANWETYYLRQDRKIVPVEMNLTFIYDEEGAITGSVGIVRNITERKRVGTSLKRSEEKYHNLIELASAGILVAENDTITQVNRTAEEIYGYSKDELIGRSPSILSPDTYKERHRKILLDILTSGKADKMIFEEEGLRKDGSLVPIEISFTLEIDKENMIIAVVRDISERRKAEEERSRLLDELKDKNKELEQLVYIASHDLRSPLVNVQGFSNELKHAFEHVRSTVCNGEYIPPQVKEMLAATLDEEIPESIHYILTSIAKMDSLLAGLLRFSRLGRAALNITTLNMDKIVGDITKSFEYQAKEAGVTLTIEPLPSCLGDETQVNQVFSNLIDNALKYRKPSRPGLIAIGGGRENGNAVYYVEDDGIGIAPEHQDKIYELFHRLDPKATQGEGLGLAITRKILDRHTGKIWVKSEQGKGSTFFVSLPAN